MVRSDEVDDTVTGTRLTVKTSSIWIGRGTLSVDYVNDFGSNHDKTHVELRWTGCAHV